MRLFRRKPLQQQQQPADVAAEVDQPGGCCCRPTRPHHSGNTSRSKAGNTSTDAFPFTHILITGASSGLGAGLATAAAAPGVTLTLLGRSQERLEAVAAAAGAKGAVVATEVVDVRDREAVAAAVWRADARAPLDLVIANAGLLHPSSSTTTPSPPPATQHQGGPNPTAAAKAGTAEPQADGGGGGAEASAWHHLAGLAEGLEELAATNIGGTVNTLSAVLCVAASRLTPAGTPHTTAGAPPRLHVAIVSSVSALAPRATLFAGLLGQRLTPYAWTKQSLALLAAGVQGELLAAGGGDVLSVSLVTPGVMVTPGAVSLAAATTGGTTPFAAAAAGGGGGAAAGGGSAEEDMLVRQFGAVGVEEAAAAILRGCAERQPLIAFPRRALRVLSLLRLAPTAWLAGRVRRAMAAYQRPPPALQQQEQGQGQRSSVPTAPAGKDSSSAGSVGGWPAAGVGPKGAVAGAGGAGWKEAVDSGPKVLAATLSTTTIITTPQRRTDTAGSSGSGVSAWSGGSSSGGSSGGGGREGLVVVRPVGGAGHK